MGMTLLDEYDGVIRDLMGIARLAIEHDTPAIAAAAERVLHGGDQPLAGRLFHLRTLLKTLTEAADEKPRRKTA